MRLPTKIFLLFIASILFFTQNLFAQQGNIWVFGYHAGLDFNSLPPKPFKTAVQEPNIGTIQLPSIASVSISDCKGKLLFYGTDAEIYNRFNNEMPHGHLNGSEGSGTIYIVPIPNDSNRYFYIQQLDGGGTKNGQFGLYYSIVDMRLDSGRGDVVDTSNEIFINSTPNTFTVIKNADDTNYWLICPVKHDTTYVYPLTANGIGHPMREPMKISFTDPSQIKGNHKANKVIFAGVGIKSYVYGGAQYDFNNKYGLLSNPQMFYDRTPDYGINDSNILWSVEYSDNDSLFYVTGSKTNSLFQYENFLYQGQTYHLSAGLLNLKTIIYSSSAHGFPGLTAVQLGPDNGVYWGIPGDSFLNVVRNPDNPGLACHLEMNAVSLSPGFLGLYLPNIYAPVRKLRFLTKDSICADSVHFANISDTVYFRSFKWYFGDGDSSAIRSPWHSYQKSGAYNVMLVGVNDCGAKLYYSDSIHVFKPALAGFAIDTVKYSCLSATLQLHRTIKDSGQTYLYLYGDSADTTADTAHVYTSSGTYNVTQFATNGHCISPLSKTVHINIEPAPKAGYVITNADQCSPYKLDIKNSSQNADKSLWLLDNTIKDTGTVSLSLSVSSLDTGYHSLSLITSNNQGCIDTFKSPKAIYIAQKPVPAFKDSLVTLCNGIKTIITNQSTYANTYLWKFGDAATDTTVSPTHIYKTSGTFQLSLTAYNSYCSNSVTQNIKINIPTVNASFSAESTTGCQGLKTIFVNSSFDATTFSWNFGDPVSASNTDTNANPEHSFSQPGKYSVSLIATSPQGCKDSIKMNNYINVLPLPKAGLSIADSTVLCGMLRYTFKNNSTNADTFTWAFGDGTSNSVNSDTGISHFYNNSGSYIITLKASNGYCSDSANIKTKITVRPATVAKFKTGDSTVCLGEPVHFVNQSTNTDSVSWDFGDGSAIDASQNPTYLYNKPGVYTARLNAMSKQGCNKQYSQMITINAIPHAVAGTSQNICSGTVIQLGTSEISGQTYGWTSRPAGFRSNLSSPIDSPKTTTEYHLNQVISSTGCTDSDSVRITIVPRPNVQFDSKFIGGFEYQFIVNNPNYPAYQYHWLIANDANGVTDTASGYKLSYIFPKNDKYSVVLRVSLPGYCMVLNTKQFDINEAFSLTIFPNPFDLQTDIQYTLINPAHIKISMTDAIGRQIGTLVDQLQNQGEYSLKYDGAAWKTRPGMYFIVFQMDDKVIVKKIIQLASIYY